MYNPKAMTYEDQFNPAVDSDNTSVEMKLNKMKAAELSKQLDTKYEKYTIPFNKTWKDGKFYKKVTIENYGSGQTGSRIRNAVTGQRYNYLVGDAEEDLFFKVVDATGRLGRKESLMLYYDSPEQYENHQFVILSQVIKEKWYEKFLEAKRVYCQ